jgi:uncharacterized protein (TIGR00369 family)
MSGIEILRAMLAGRLPHPSMANTLGFSLVAVTAGMAKFECSIGPHLLNPFGTVHGGVALSLIDSAAGCALHSLLPAGTGYTSVETKVNYTRPLRRDSGVVTAIGEVLSQGKRIATAEAKLRTADGELVAHGTSTILLLTDVDWSIAGR